jgi:hypothetical protein
MSATGDETKVRAVPWWQAVGAALRGTLGALSLVGGLTWLLLNLQGARFATDVLVGAVLAAGGLVLLMPHRVRLRPVASILAAGAASLAGTAAGLLVSTSQLGGMFVYVTARGYPFHWVHRGASAGDPETARRLADAAQWQLDPSALVGDALFWAYAGLLVLVAADRARRAMRGRVGARP